MRHGWMFWVVAAVAALSVACERGPELEQRVRTASEARELVCEYLVLQPGEAFDRARMACYLGEELKDIAAAYAGCPLPAPMTPPPVPPVEPPAALGPEPTGTAEPAP